MGVWFNYVLADPLIHRMFHLIGVEFEKPASKQLKRLPLEEDSLLREAGLSSSERDDLAYLSNMPFATENEKLTH